MEVVFLNAEGGVAHIISTGVVAGVSVFGEQAAALLGVLFRLGGSLRRARDLMNPHPVTVERHIMLAEAEALMRERRIAALVVCDKGCPVGVVKFFA